ncbi:MAG: SMP-30/gluconolactonase/LRE family protein [Firmicutes bacterium]|nr:SMP-30/gluconolactonase/LRE family protein [Bacillota bacterium]
MKYLVGQNESIFRIGGSFQLTEGPVWLKEDGCLLFSDVPASIIYKWSSDQGLSEWRKPSHNADGNTVDREGRLITCELGSRRVTRTEKDGKITVLAKTYQGKRLNSPNDVVVKRDGTIWFTDLPYGITPEMKEQSANYVFRLDPGKKEPVPVAGDFSLPNGLCFSPDEKSLYIVDSDTELHYVRVFGVTKDNTLEEGNIFAVICPGVPDGMRMDSEGHLLCTAGDGVQVFNTNGHLIGKILTPRVATNCAFGGSTFNELFITATDSVWRIPLRVAGAA